MKRKSLPIFIATLVLCTIAIVFVYTQLKNGSKQAQIEKNEQAEGVEFDIRAREEWELVRLRDPNTGQIPQGIRAKELAFAAQLPKNNVFRKSSDAWEPVGPWNVGGRTRAIAIDVTDEKILIAGGATGGLWRSEDAGQNWVKTTTPTQVNAITCIVQDTRTGKTNTWYAGSGELTGGSASKSGAYFAGNGMLKSTDGGKTWAPLTKTVSNTVSFDSEFDGMWAIKINEATNDSDVVFAATYGSIYRSIDGGANWQRRRGGTSGAANPSYYTDVAVTKTGVVYATLSSTGANKGIWRSTDNGTTWKSILPPNFPAEYERMVIGLVPQDENHLYILAVTPGKGKMTKNFRGDEEWNSLWKYTYLSGDGTGSGGVWEDRSASIPDFPGDFETFNAQGGYDYYVHVHPTDSNFVYIGGSNLFRSADAFRTNTKIKKVGGYGIGTKRPDFEVYENHHPDQHNLIFFASNANKAISTHDGGISITDNIKADVVKWQVLNNGYTTSQFYSVSLNEAKAGDYTIIGGLQDNGTYFTDKNDRKNPWTQIFNYDGAFSHVAANGQDYYVTKQEAGIYRIRLDNNYKRVQSARIDPPGNYNYLFINPFCTDPNDDKRVFVLAGAGINRCNDVTQIQLKNFLDTNRTAGLWDSLNTTVTGTALSAISMSVAPAGILFYGTQNGRVFKMANATTGQPVAVEITGAGFPNGNVSNICVHPEDANKLIAVFTNYGLRSLFYTENGGQSWNDIGGNLEQNVNGTGNGPSCRWAAFIKTEAGYGVLVATSVGLFSIPKVDTVAANVWVQQSPNGIGNAVCEMIKVRRSDGRVVVATHGAGIYAATITNNYHLTGVDEAKNNISFTIYPNPATDFVTVVRPNTAKGNIIYTVYDMKGTKLAENTSADAEVKLNIQALSQGTYVLRIENQYANGTQFFIKK
jgi:photosystem II stability/assembly factor-like uncharacterized protein